MELSTKYNPSTVEEKWYRHWLDHGFFHSEPDGREPFTIVIPPPNVTGILHMGHVLNNTLNDVLVRKARMDGKNACWVPGTDHASIATENKVIEKLAGMGIAKESLTREEFLAHAWAWKEEHGGIILEQLRKLGASCDWDRTRFTMEPELNKAVTATFVYFYRKGLIYKGVRMVNWDPVRQTALSDEEVEHIDTASHLYHIRYHLSDGNGNPTDDYLTIATTRPETIMADAAICVNPADERHFRLHGRKVLIPLINREIPVILDDYVDMAFGTGCLKVTPAHDVHDYEIGLRHNLPVIDIIDPDGRLNAAARILVGEDRFAAREKIVRMLEEAGNLEKTESYNSPVGYSQRSHAVIEPRLSTQWFLRMEPLAAMAMKAVDEGRIRLTPEKFTATWDHWLGNIRDWCISRQLWWGQRIPAYYLPDGRYVVEETPEAALEAARRLDPSVRGCDLRQDEDVLDTWFSSWLWPISVFDPKYPGHPERTPNRDLSYYYPTTQLVTAPDIIFFWVARMVMAGEEFMGREPFGNVYFTGLVRDHLGRKMSKQLGNSPNPLDLIAQYGADSVRMGMMLCTSAGNDIFYDVAQVEQGRNLCGKIWNSYRLVKGWTVDASAPQPEVAAVSVKWFGQKLSQTVATVEDHYGKLRINDALMAIYRLFWDDYCSWYLEMVKPAYGQPVDKATYEATIGFFDALLRLFHPVMPFITEELWQDLAPRGGEETIMYAPSPKAGQWDGAFLAGFEAVQQTVQNVRSIRQGKNIPPKEALELDIKGGGFPVEFLPVVAKLCNLSRVEVVESFPERPAVSFMVGTLEMAVPVGGLVDTAAEAAKIRADLEHQRNFLAGVRKKLSNENFVAHAPQKVVDLERKKEADSLSKIASLESQLKALEGSE